MKLQARSNLYILLIVWAIVHFIFIYHHGIISAGEAGKYISEAHTFLNTGTVSATNFWFYFTQIFLLAIAFKWGLGFIFVLIIQLIFSAWATYAFYRLAASLFSIQTAFIGTLLFLLNYPLHEFTVYLQTESLFHSFTIIFTAYLLRLSKLNLIHIITIAFSTILICITRPTGLFFVPAIVLYLFFGFFKAINPWSKVGIVAAAGIVFLWLMNAVIGSKGEWDFMLPYRDEQIICGAPTLDHNVDIKTYPDGDSIYGLFYYIVYNFEQFSRMAFLKSKAFFGLLRSHYSTSHNIFLVAFFYPIYAAALLSLKWWVKNNGYRLLYFSTLLLMTWGTTLLTCDDWHNRWFLSISPWVILTGLPAITKLLAILTSYGNKQNIQP
jgi:hypothetical protein